MGGGNPNYTKYFLDKDKIYSSTDMGLTCVLTKGQDYKNLPKGLNSLGKPSKFPALISD